MADVRNYQVMVEHGPTFWSDLGTVLKMAEADAENHPSIVRLRQLWHVVGEELNIAEHE